ncbi:ParB family protein [Rouxiella badensis]|uniref:ParB family protein n=1 Tax=Rouxiella badensis TaxID=1646377 RepID=UPI001D142621|nr:ParB family protein [Rouxiella badensis]MCC3705158.1 ParB family protein [Rouxiella badensis]
MTRVKAKKLDLATALLQPGKLGTSSAATSPPRVEMPMLLTLDQLCPNPDNPRTSRNPKFDEIKSSIMARGLDTVPKVTLDPDRDRRYIFSDGGNTRYQILRELWEETGDRKYFHLQCIFKPWPGRLACVIGHLAENEVRGELSFIEKAFGIQQARNIYEEQLGRRVTLRAFSDLLSQQGYPIHYSNISRMEDTVKYLFPCVPTILEAGMGRPQIQSLLAVRSNALKTWETFKPEANQETTFDSVFREVCRQLDDPEIYTLEMLLDELIGALIEALPHPALNYDRWLLELDPKEQTRRLHFGEPEPEVFVAENRESAPQKFNKTRVKGPDAAAIEELRALNHENSDDDPEYNDEREVGSDSAWQEATPAMYSLINESESTPELSEDKKKFIWDIVSLQDDIEHLQVLNYRLAFEIAEHASCQDDIQSVKNTLHSVGFSLGLNCINPVSVILGALTGNSPGQVIDSSILSVIVTGTESANGAPMLNDAQTINFFRLIRLIRRLRELQRPPLTTDDLKEDVP